MPGVDAGIGKLVDWRFFRLLWLTGLAAFFVWTGLDAFILTKSLLVPDDDLAPEAVQDDDDESKLPIYYADADGSIRIQKFRWKDTTIFDAEIKLTDATQIRRFLAHDTYGINIREETSLTAARNNAAFAVNGDYYSVRKGLVVVNGKVLREFQDTIMNNTLVIDTDGNFNCAKGAPGGETAAWQGFQFGPTLIDDGVIDESMFTGRLAGPHPRTAIGQIGPLHYVFVVSEGRSGTEKGLTLSELAEYFKSRNCTEAYNLDGGGTATMVWRGRMLNDNAAEGYERPVADIIGVML